METGAGRAQGHPLKNTQLMFTAPRGWPGPSRRRGGCGAPTHRTHPRCASRACDTHASRQNAAFAHPTKRADASPVNAAVRETIVERQVRCSVEQRDHRSSLS